MFNNPIVCVRASCAPSSGVVCAFVQVHVLTNSQPQLEVTTLQVGVLIMTFI